MHQWLQAGSTSNLWEILRTHRIPSVVPSVSAEPATVQQPPSLSGRLSSKQRSSALIISQHLKNSFNTSLPQSTAHSTHVAHVFKQFQLVELGTRLTGGREEISTPSILAFCFSADLQWSEHPSPFWTFHAAVPLVKAASSRNYMGKYMFFSGFAKHPNYLFQWMKPLLKVMVFLHQIDKVWHQFFGRTRQICLTPHPLLDHWMHTLAHCVMVIFLFVCLQFLR